MRTTTLSFSTFALILIALAFSGAGKKGIQKAYVKIDSNLYASRFEVTNREYGLFLEDLKKNTKTETYQACLFDSTQWQKKFPHVYKQTYEMYHYHPGYNDYPIVNISIEAAREYCKWLTDKQADLGNKSPGKIVFRLPTEREWNKLAAALPGHNLPWAGNLPVSGGDGKTYQANVKVRDLSLGYLSYNFDGYLMAARVKSFQPNNRLGIYNVIGNVSEMTEEGKLKGGNTALTKFFNPGLLSIAGLQA